MKNLLRDMIFGKEMPLKTDAYYTIRTQTIKKMNRRMKIGLPSLTSCNDRAVHGKNCQDLTESYRPWHSMASFLPRS